MKAPKPLPSPCEICIKASIPETPAQPVCQEIKSVHFAKRCSEVTHCTSQIVAIVETTGKGNRGWLR